MMINFSYSGNSASFNLADGTTVTIDIKDTALVKDFTWYLLNKKKRYVAAEVKGKTLYLHRLVSGATRCHQVKIKDGDGTNCTRANLELKLVKYHSTGVQAIDNYGSGIYSITCLKDGSVYVGSSKKLALRFEYHMHDLQRDKHTNKNLTAAYAKYEPKDFTFSILQLCSESQLLSQEQVWIDFYRSLGVTLMNQVLKVV